MQKYSLALHTCHDVLNLVRQHMPEQQELEVKVLINLGWLQKQLSSFTEAIETFNYIYTLLHPAQP